jgi:predicted nuclease of predicted toxin-antitoxin system
MRFKLDENLPLEALKPLRSAGHDSEHVLEEDLGGASDIQIAEFCRTENRALITLDTGFGDITRYPPQTTA